MSQGTLNVGYDYSNNKLEALRVDSNGRLSVDINSGGGGGTQFAVGSALGATPTGTLLIGRDGSGNADDVGITSLNELKVKDASANTSLTSISADATTLAGAVSGGAMTVDITADSVGLATSTNQSTMISSLGTLAGAVAGAEFQCDVVSSALPSGAATSALQTTGNTSLSTIAGAVDGTEMQCDILSSALPTGAATSALQTTGNTSLATIAGDTTSLDGKIPSNGQTTMSGSVPVVVASDQSYIPSIKRTPTATSQSISVSANGTGRSNAMDMEGCSRISIYGNTGNVSDPLQLEVSDDDTNYYTDGSFFATVNFSTGDFVVHIDNAANRYMKLFQTDTTNTAFTLLVKTSKR